MSRHTTITEEGMRTILEGLLNGKTNNELASDLGKNVAAVKQASCMFNVYAGGDRAELAEQSKVFLKNSSVPTPEIARRVLYGWKKMSSTAVIEGLRTAMYNAPNETETAVLSDVKSPVPPIQQSGADEEEKKVIQEPFQPDKKAVGKEMGRALGTLEVDAYKTDPSEWKETLKACMKEIACCLQNLIQKL